MTNQIQAQGDIFKGLGVEVFIENPDNFLLIVETLTRMGIFSKRKNSLTQSCHILHRKGRYHIVHFLEMFLMDNRTANILPEDLARRNRIIYLLEQWGLLKIDPKEVENIKKTMSPLDSIKIVSFKEKFKVNLISKYTIGRPR